MKILALLLILTGCANYQQPCPFKQFLVDPNCR